MLPWASLKKGALVAELIFEVTGGDVALLRRALARTPGLPSVLRSTYRVVVGGATISRHPEIAATVRSAGATLLVDPQTHLLQDEQHPDDPWATLDFAQASRVTAEDLSRTARVDELVSSTLEFQLEHGATALILPYVHVESSTSGWMEVQGAIWRRSQRYLVQQGLRLPVMPVLALGWRLVDRGLWPLALRPMQQTLVELEPWRVAIAASKIDMGVRSDVRLVGLLGAIRALRDVAPVVAWKQGALGDAAIAAGAIGYQTGIGWGERCDLRSAMTQHRRPPTAGPAGRPSYIRTLGRSLPKRSLRGLVADGRLTHELVCLDTSCCPTGREALLADARTHALAARSQRIANLEQVARSAWRWAAVARDADAALALAERINRIACDRPDVSRVDTRGLTAMKIVADNRRQTLLRRHAA